MNQEIHTIVEDMQGRSHKDAYGESEKHTRQLAQMARFLALLAEESEKQNNKISEQTEKMIRFTKAIVALTWVLIFIGSLQIITMIVSLLR